MTIAVAGAVIGGSLLSAAPAGATTAATGLDVISTVAGGGFSTTLTNAQSATGVALGSPVVAVYDSHGNIVIADQDNNVIRVVAGSTGTWYGMAMTAGHIYTLVGNGTDGYSGDGACSKGKCIPLTSVELSDPNGVAVDAAGDMAITDTGNEAVRFVCATTGPHFGINMTAGGIYTVATGDGTFFPVEQANAAALAEPDGVAFDPQGDIIVADTDNDVIRLIPNTARVAYGQDVQPGFIYDIAGNSNYGFTGNGTPGTSAELSLEPLTGIAVDAAGNVAFPDSDNEVIRMVAAGTGSYHGRAVRAGDIYTIAGNSNEGFGGNKKPALSAMIDTPEGVAYDSAGDLFIGDSANNMIRYVPAATGVLDGKPVTAGDIYTYAGNGAMGRSGNGGAAVSAELNNPAGVSVGPNRHVLIVDNGNNLIRQVVPPSPSITALKQTTGATTGNKKVTIVGVNLSGATAVMFGSRHALRFTVSSAKKVVAYTPASTPGAVVVRVVTPAGSTPPTAADVYHYVTAAPKRSRARHGA